jgi:1-acyl-sn-glycerol-3-phosphate acyltransferase
MAGANKPTCGVSTLATPAVLAARVAFALAFFTCLVTIWTIAQLIHALPGFGTKRNRHGYCVGLSQRCFRWIMLWPCWWIKLVGLGELEAAWCEVNSAGTPYVLANHNSMMDSLLVTALIPSSISFHMRSLIKLALFEEPIFGYICKAVGTWNANG